MSETHGTIYWTELMTRDVDAALEYYKAICGWSYDTMEMPEGPYHVAMLGERPVAGIVQIDEMEEMKALPPHWLSYIAVDDVDAAVAATRKAGGQVTRDPFDVPGVGRVAMLYDPSGAAIGLMTPTDEPMS